MLPKKKPGEAFTSSRLFICITGFYFRITRFCQPVSRQSLKLPDLDITIPYIITMILQSDVTLGCNIGPVGVESRELAACNKCIPLRSPKMILKNGLTILDVPYTTLVNLDFSGVPLSCRFGVLRHCRDQVIERSGLTVAVFASLCIRMPLIVKNLHLRCGLPDVIQFRTLLCQVENTAVATF